MPKYRKKPVVINALQFDGSAASATLVIDWMLHHDTTVTYREEQTELRVRGELARTAHPACLRIPTLEGVMEAHPGDWIIQGVQGEFYPCKPDIFAATYDAAS